MKLLLAAVVCAFVVRLPAGSAAGVNVQGTAVAGGKPLADAVVWVDVPGAARRPQQKAVLDQRNLDFYPRVLVVQVGTVVDFPNHDRVFHNVFSFRDGRKFDLGLYPVGAVRRIPFDRPGLSRVFCNIHPNMAAYIMVVDTPHFAQSGRDGRFVLPDLPAGTFTYHAWRSGAPILSGQLAVQPGATLDVQWP